MRKIFVDTVMLIMKSDPNVIFLTGDLGFGSFEVIKESFPDRFFNMGIAEQNMICVASGLSLVGKKVILYSIANFATLRVLEQIRNYLLYHDNHVLIVNGGGGFSYGQLGYTHHAVEDISIMKSLPQMDIFAPFDSLTVESSIWEWYKSDRVAYLRLEKSSVDGIKNIEYTKFGALINSNNSVDKFIITYGTIISEALEANTDAVIVALSKPKRIDEDVYYLIKDATHLVILEENSVYGGIGEHVLAQCLLRKIYIPYSSILGVKDFISKVIGDQVYLRKLHNMSAKDISIFFNN